MSSKIKFNIAYIKLSTKTEGPFNRCCIWFQGCNLHCKGCCNENLQSFIPNHIVSLEELISIVNKAKENFDIEGVTLSGGEPSLQTGLIEFNKELHKMNLGIIMFSGLNKIQLSQDLVQSVDLLIDGPFIENKLDTKRILLGSTNKNLSFITERYLNQKSYFDNQVSLEEITVEDYLFINGD